ncbi:decaprenyl-phosphate phosphoribosyltransferase [Ilumatobacter nonamiensis]|uniref:decaprenyl-phosphate phosphoribosyltransferase n=1 Tax=Ilumatobacter nonamiensis TaxID=467093 RepID=UPI000349A7B3|nr:decaprenyl-phosphate phosphoribosyltransferase [Ilumatobacter nonamiensis]
MIGPLIKEMRPKQWLKNVLVFAAPGAAGVLDEPSDLVATVLAFVAFCFAASGIYIWNDLNDIEADRVHPTKRHRPIPAGTLSIPVARAAGVVLPIAALAVAAATGRWETVAIVAVYIAITLCYTFWLKEVEIIDLLAVASGFVLRAAGGAVAVDVPMSRWFILCVTFGSLFIVVGKRYAELQEVGIGAGTRSTLDVYTPGFLRMLLSVSLGGALISYCVWAFETAVGTDFPFYELSVVPMIAALFRYLLVLERGQGSAPEEVFASDRVLQLAGVAWIIIYGVAVYTA